MKRENKTLGGVKEENVILKMLECYYINQWYRLPSNTMFSSAHLISKKSTAETEGLESTGMERLPQKERLKR